MASSLLLVTASACYLIWRRRNGRESTVFNGAATARAARVPDTAAGTANFEVAQFLLGQPGVDVNAKSTYNETPYDNASGNEMRKLLALAGGRPGCNPTQLSAKECKRGQLAS
jgi:hypothetical protein